MTSKRHVSFGLRLPTFALEGETAGLETISEYVQRAEKLGFSSVFLIDHFITAPPAYVCSWLEPMTLLSALASSTRRVKLGTLVLVLPLWHPVKLAKITATLDFLSGGRLILGVGSGWNEKEFETIGVSLKNRGSRVEEGIEILRRLWTGSNVSYSGRFFRCKDLTIEPKPLQKPSPPIWIGGGSQPFELVYGRKAVNVEPVLRRIAKLADGWTPHSSSTPSMVREDWEKICRYSEQFGRDPGKLELAYSNFVYVLAKDEVASEASASFSRFSGMNLDYWRRYYLLGTAEDIVQRILARTNAVGGMDHIILNPVNFDYEQLERLADEVTPNLK